MINKVYICTRPGADTQITDSMLIAVGDVFRNYKINVINRTDEIDENTLVLALGGDGTMLSAIRLAAESESYVTGFNYGHLGYLTHPAPSTTKGLQEEINYLITSIGYVTTPYKLPMLMSKFRNPIGVIRAVNDFYFVPAANGTALNYYVNVDGVQAFETRSSGIVIATPMGSTGLALSAGGAVLSPQSKVFEVAPMLPHTLTSRPLIVPDSSTIEVTWEVGYHSSIRADGRLIDDEYVTSVEMKKSLRGIKMIHPENWNFYDNLRDKMKWNT